MTFNAVTVAKVIQNGIRFPMKGRLSKNEGLGINIK